MGRSRKDHREEAGERMAYGGLDERHIKKVLRAKPDEGLELAREDRGFDELAGPIDRLRGRTRVEGDDLLDVQRGLLRALEDRMVAYQLAEFEGERQDSYRRRLSADELDGFHLEEE